MSDASQAAAAAAAAAGERIDAVNLIVSPAIGKTVVAEMHSLGIQHLFIQPGADTPSVLAAAADAGEDSGVSGFVLAAVRPWFKRT